MLDRRESDVSVRRWLGIRSIYLSYPIYPCYPQPMAKYGFGKSGGTQLVRREGSHLLFIAPETRIADLTGATSKVWRTFLDQAGAIETVVRCGLLLVNRKFQIDEVLRADVFRSDRFYFDIDTHLFVALTRTLADALPAWQPADSPAKGFRTIEISSSVNEPGPGNRKAQEVIFKVMDIVQVANTRQSRSVTHQRQIDSRISFRKTLRDSVAMLDVDEWAALRGTDGPNPSAALGKYKTKQRLFSVPEGRRELYPQFQFDDNASPLPGMEKVLRIVPQDAHGWPLLSWFNSSNPLLAGRKPLDVLKARPDDVVQAAAAFYSMDD